MSLSSCVSTCVTEQLCSTCVTEQQCFHLCHWAVVFPLVSLSNCVSRANPTSCTSGWRFCLLPATQEVTSVSSWGTLALEQLLLQVRQGEGLLWGVYVKSTDEFGGAVEGEMWVWEREDRVIIIFFYYSLWPYKVYSLSP